LAQPILTKGPFQAFRPAGHLVKTNQATDWGPSAVQARQPDGCARPAQTPSQSHGQATSASTTMGANERYPLRRPLRPVNRFDQVS
jgi:hypothetical protein